MAAVSVRALISMLLLASAGAAYTQADHKGIQYMDSSWMTAKWTEGDQEFAMARADIERVSDDRKHLGRIIQNVVTKAKENSSKVTSMDLFRWCTAMILSSSTFDEWRKLDGNRQWKSPYELFPRLSKPDSFEFTRVRFLYTARFDFPHHNLVQIGEKVFRKKQDDPVVGRMLLRLYQPQAFPDDRAKGEELVKVLEKLGKDRLPILTVVSDFYHRCWMKSKSKADANEAIIRSEQALTLTKSYEQAQIIRSTIAQLRASS